MRFPSALRRVTDPLADRIRIPILGGVNRGRWWSLASAGSGYGLGLRASMQMELLAALIRPDDVVWDVGAHHGYVTLLAARIVGGRGRVCAFEPSARNRHLLEQHLAWNHEERVTVMGCALSSYDGEATFGGHGSSKTLALGAGEERVVVRRACGLVDQGVCPAPIFAKVDVEGAEADFIEGVLPILPADARLLIAMHNAGADARIAALLGERGFAFLTSTGLRDSRRGRWRRDPDLYCTGPAAAPTEPERLALERFGFSA